MATSVQLAFFGYKVCETCGEVFDPKGTQRFCASACRSPKRRPKQVVVTRDNVERARELVRENLDQYFYETGAVQGPCGALAKVLSIHGWGRIACGYYGYYGQNPEQLNEIPRMLIRDGRGEIRGTEEAKDGWRAHWVNVNKFYGVIDVSGAYLAHTLAAPIYRTGHLTITDSIRINDKDLWSREEVNFWEVALAPVLFESARPAANEQPDRLGKSTVAREKLM